MPNTYIPSNYDETEFLNSVIEKFNIPYDIAARLHSLGQVKLDEIQEKEKELKEMLTDEELLEERIGFLAITVNTIMDYVLDLRFVGARKELAYKIVNLIDDQAGIAAEELDSDKITRLRRAQ